jgi:hypothetical protein
MPEALTNQPRELYLNHVQARAVYRRVDKLDPLRQLLGLLWWEGFLESHRRVRREVVQDQTYPLGLR